MGKGSSPRPFSVSQDKFGENFDAIFGKKKKNEEPPKQPVDEDKQVKEVDNGTD